MFNIKRFSESQILKVNECIKYSEESEITFESLQVKDSVTYYHASNKFLCNPDD